MIQFYKNKGDGFKRISKRKYNKYLEALANYEGLYQDRLEETEEGKISRTILFADLDIIAVFDEWEEYDEATK